MDELLLRYWRRFVNRGDTYCVQQANGRYRRERQPLTESLLQAHLDGRQTLALDAVDGRGLSRWLCFDSDAADGLTTLGQARDVLTDLGLTGWCEASRRGGHLWVCFDAPQPAGALRRLAAGVLQRVGVTMEAYPNVDAPSGASGVAQPMRLPFGVHQVTHERYPFLDGKGRPCHRNSWRDGLAWLSAQTPNMTHQLQAALRAMPIVAPVVPVVPSSIPAAGALVVPAPSGTRPDKAWGVVAWVKAQPLPTLIASTRPEVALRAAGRGAIGWCPFHDDSAPQEDGSPGTPSLYVYCDPTYGWHWKCLSSHCGAWMGKAKDSFDWLVWCAGGRWREALTWALHLEEESI